MSTNDITGDKIKSRKNSKEYRDNYDKAFKSVPAYSEGVTVETLLIADDQPIDRE